MSEIVATGRHPDTVRVARFFSYSHLPLHLQEVSREFHGVAAKLIGLVPDGPFLTEALFRLLDAKNAAVCARVEQASGLEPARQPTATLRSTDG